MKKTVALYVAIFVIGFLAAVAVSGRTRPAQVEVVQRGPSAAGTITAVLAAIIGLAVILAACAAGAILVSRARKDQLRMEQAALLFGTKPQTPSAPRPPRRPQIPQGSGNVIIVSGDGSDRWEV